MQRHKLLTHFCSTSSRAKSELFSSNDYLEDQLRWGEMSEDLSW